MLTEFFQQRPLAQFLCGGPLWFPAAADRAAWEALPAALRAELLALAEEYRAQPYPLRKATDFLAFVRSGSRKADENPYFLRRRKLCAAALGYCVQPNREDLDQVIDGVWCICEEISWVISAHNVNPIPGAPAAADYPLPDAGNPYIDLFAGQTAMILTLVVHLMGEALDGVSPALRSLVQGEIQRRIFTPFMATDNFWWMGVKRADLNNWTPWILSNIMLSAAGWLQDKALLAALMERACLMLDRWLAVMPEDGGCDEGAGYWNMAGGALLDCLEVLERATGGQVTFWQNEKLRRILSFPAKARVQGEWFINFADCDARPLLSGERLQWAGERLNDASLAALGAQLRGELAEQLSDTPQFWRLLNMIFHPPCAAEQTDAQQDVWLPDLQVRLVRRGGMALCAKGGHNNENHNHNDVGSFMLYVDGEPQLVDAGNMVYTAKTFSSQRYTLWNVRGAYHNLPIIGGCEQLHGAERIAREVQCLPDGLALDMACAYDGVDTCRRSLRLTEEGLILQDEIITPQPRDVQWVFILRHRPEIGPASLQAGSICMSFNSDLIACVEEIPVTDERMARNFPGSLWRVTLTEGAARRHQRTFMIARNRYDTV